MVALLAGWRQRASYSGTSIARVRVWLGVLGSTTNKRVTQILDEGLLHRELDRSKVSVPKMLSGVNAFEISDIQEDEIARRS
jgi:hypothetical protein